MKYKSLTLQFLVILILNSPCSGSDGSRDTFVVGRFSDSVGVMELGNEKYRLRNFVVHEPVTFRGTPLLIADSSLDRRFSEDDVFSFSIDPDELERIVKEYESSLDKSTEIDEMVEGRDVGTEEERSFNLIKSIGIERQIVVVEIRSVEGDQTQDIKIDD